LNIDQLPPADSISCPAIRIRAKELVKARRDQDQRSKDLTELEQTRSDANVGWLACWTDLAVVKLIVASTADTRLGIRSLCTNSPSHRSTRICPTS
jgi:hypothetical protein